MTVIGFLVCLFMGISLVRDFLTFWSEGTGDVDWRYARFHPHWRDELTMMNAERRR